MSDQYPGQVPPTQVTPQPGYGQPAGQPGGSPYPQNPGYYPPPPGGPGGPGGFPPAPPKGGGGGKGILIVVAVVAVLVLIGGGIAAALLLTGDDGDDDEPKKKVTRTVTADVSDGGSGSTDGGTDTTSSDVPADPTATAQQVADTYLNAVFDSDCTTIQSISTEEWFSSAYGDIQGCQDDIGMPIMEDVETTYDPVQADGTNATVTALLTDNTDNSTYALEWQMDCATGVCLVTNFTADVA